MSRTHEIDTLEDIFAGDIDGSGDDNNTIVDDDVLEHSTVDALDSLIAEAENVGDSVVSSSLSSSSPTSSSSSTTSDSTSSSSSTSSASADGGLLPWMMRIRDKNAVMKVADVFAMMKQYASERSLRIVRRRSEFNNSGTCRIYYCCYGPACPSDPVRVSSNLVQIADPNNVSESSNSANRACAFDLRLTTCGKPKSNVPRDEVPLFVTSVEAHTCGHAGVRRNVIQYVDQFNAEQRNWIIEQLRMHTPPRAIRPAFIERFHIESLNHSAFATMLHQLRESIGHSTSDESFRKFIASVTTDRPANDFCKLMTVGDDNNFEAIFYQTEAMRSAFVKCGQFMMFDSTFNTNHYRLLFIMITVIDEHGNTVIAAVFVSRSESTEHIVWMLQQLRESVGDTAFQAVSAVCTDECASYAAALAQFMPHSRHHLCMFHIHQKTKKHCVSRIVSYSKENPNAMTCAQMNAHLKRIAYAPTPDEYEIRKAELMRLDMPNDVRLYLDMHVFPLHQKWCKAWVFRSTTFRTFATSRNECMNAKVKELGGVHCRGSLQMLFDSLFSYCKSANKIVYARFAKVPVVDSGNVNSLAPHLTDRAIAEISSHCCDFGSFTAAPACVDDAPEWFRTDVVPRHCSSADEVEWYKVSVGEGALLTDSVQYVAWSPSMESMCTCLFTSNVRLPCKHVMACNRVKKLNFFIPEQTLRRWLRISLCEEIASELVRSLPPVEFRVEDVPHIRLDARRRRNLFDWWPSVVETYPEIADLGTSFSDCVKMAVSRWGCGSLSTFVERMHDFFAQEIDLARREGDAFGLNVHVDARRSSATSNTTALLTSQNESTVRTDSELSLSSSSSQSSPPPSSTPLRVRNTKSPTTTAPCLFSSKQPTPNSVPASIVDHRTHVAAPQSNSTTVNPPSKKRKEKPAGSFAPSRRKKNQVPVHVPSPAVTSNTTAPSASSQQLQHEVASHSSEPMQFAAVQQQLHLQSRASSPPHMVVQQQQSLQSHLPLHAIAAPQPFLSRVPIHPVNGMPAIVPQNSIMHMGHAWPSIIPSAYIAMQMAPQHEN